AARGHAAPEVRDSFRKARALCPEVGDPRRMNAVFVGIYLHRFFSADHAGALRTAEEILQFSKGHHDPEASLLVAASLYHLGKLELAESRLRQAVPDTKSLGDRPPRDVDTSWQDMRVTDFLLRAVLFYPLGYLDQAAVHKHAALTRARALSHPFNTVQTLAIVCVADWFGDDARGLLEHSSELVTLSTEQGYALFLPLGLIQRGRAKVQDGRVAEGIMEIESGIAGYRATG